MLETPTLCGKVGCQMLITGKTKKPILSLRIPSPVTMTCFTLTAVTLLLSLYTVVFIKMSLGFNKGVSHPLFWNPSVPWCPESRLYRSAERSLGSQPGWGLGGAGDTSSPQDLRGPALSRWRERGMELRAPGRSGTARCSLPGPSLSPPYPHVQAGAML